MSIATTSYRDDDGPDDAVADAHRRALEAASRRGRSSSAYTIANRRFVQLIGLALVLAFLVTELTPLQRIFDTVSLTSSQWGICLLGPIVYLVAVGGREALRPPHRPRAAGRGSGGDLGTSVPGADHAPLVLVPEHADRRRVEREQAAVLGRRRSSARRARAARGRGRRPRRRPTRPRAPRSADRPARRPRRPSRPRGRRRSTATTPAAPFGSRRWCVPRRSRSPTPPGRLAPAPSRRGPRGGRSPSRARAGS